ncbi:hypothetical protein F5Y17DRAFT_21998 [Xylariaceae sp. FL0594]|nr:hypothetical protein F5Y17DRAFT_21998 [Xylariaceae sp. FL0594]
MDESWVHTLEPGREPVTLGQVPLPKPKPQRFRSARVVGSGRQELSESSDTHNTRATEAVVPRRNSAYYATQEESRQHLSSQKFPRDSGINETFSLGSVSLKDEPNGEHKLGDELSTPDSDGKKLQHNEKETREKETPTEVKVSKNSMLRTRPSVRDCNWEQFKNRYPDDETRAGIPAIEVLLAQDDLGQQMEADRLRRLPEDQRNVLEEARPGAGANTNDTRQRNSRQQQQLPRHRKRMSVAATPAELDTSIPTPVERVRINSAIILAYLSKVTGEGPWVDRPHTFLAPFNLFVHYHSKMVQELRALEDKFGDAVPQKYEGEGGEIGPADTTDNGSLDDSSLDFLDNIPGKSELVSVMKARKAYEDMKCYVDFINDRIIARRNMFATGCYGSSQEVKVRYGDLAALFRVGDLVVEPQPGVSLQQQQFASSGNRAGLRGERRRSLLYSPSQSQVHGSGSGSRTEPKIWRVCAISEDTSNWRICDPDEKRVGEIEGQEEEPEATYLRLYYLDYDGHRFSAVRGDAVTIPYYKGEREVTSLPVYPLRFHKDHWRLLQTLEERGRRFRDMVSSATPTFTHKGWTLTKDPLGRDLASLSPPHVQNGNAEEGGGRGSSWPEYIESNVIVDFNEAFQMHPWWNPVSGSNSHNGNSQFPAADLFYVATVRDDFPVTEWSDRGRDRKHTTHEEMVVEYDGVRDIEWAETLDKDPFLSAQEADVSHSHRGAAYNDNRGHQLSQDLSPDDLALLPSRVFVYALGARRFINADIRSLKPIAQEGSDPLASLQLPEKHKLMVQSAVFGHLEKKKVRRRATLLMDHNYGGGSGFIDMDQDMIHGKGRGLAVLLHGPPGVGKTATAEAVAQYYKKPLFPITSADLGTDVWDVEAKLLEIFRLADLWDCILLLDEAETLLAQRERKEGSLQKSSIVSVFLRTLEYYPGILFLTTNRPDVMDEAVKSRMQVSLQYPRLGLIETLAIFQTNIDRLIDVEFERARVTGESALEVRSEGILAFAAAHYHRSNPPWNGRQIRNAFQIAPSIARYGKKTDGEGEGEGEGGWYVGPEHFEKVEESLSISTTNTTTTAADSSSYVGASLTNNRYSQVLLEGHLSPKLAPSYSHSHSHPRAHSRSSSATSPKRQSIHTNTTISSPPPTSAPLPLARRAMRSSTSNRHSGEFFNNLHTRQRSSSSVAPLWLSSNPMQGQEKNGQGNCPGGGMMAATTREPSPPWTPELASVSDDVSVEGSGLI